MKRTLTLTAILLNLAITGMAADSKTNYETSCGACHGKDGKGQTKMGIKLEVKDLTDKKFQDSLKDEEMFKSIKEGYKVKDQIKMKPFAEKFSDAEIKDMVKYIRSLK